MKLSHIVSASILALAMSALVAGGASAATTINGSKSNSFRTGCPAGQHMNTDTKKCEPNAPPMGATTVMGSKSNTDNKTGNTGGAPTEGVTSVNSSRSNSDNKTGNTGGSSGATPMGEQAINSSKSNSFKIGTAAGTTAGDCTNQRGTVTRNKKGKQVCEVSSAQPGSGGPIPVEATTISGSKSNQDNRTAQPSTGNGEMGSTNINTSKSNAFKIGTAAGTTAGDCTNQGGTITLGKKGKQKCNFGATGEAQPGHALQHSATAPAPTPQ